MSRHERAGTETLDGLRGLAIVLVFGYHTWLFSWYTPRWPFDVIARTGYLGVELFFLISGFCLFYPYARHALGDGPRQSLGDFAFRRFIKIVPSYFVALAVTAIVALPILRGPGALAVPLAQHALFVNNWFDDDFGTINSVFWSLGIEVQFYLVFPLLAIAFALRPVAAAAAMVGMALAYRFGLAGCCIDHETLVRQVPAYLDLFGLGMLAAYAVVFARRVPWVERGRPVFTALALVAAVALFALLSSANAVQYEPLGRERWELAGRTLLGVAGATLIVASCLGARWWRALLANPILVFLSLLSYNLYLWHALIEIWLVRHNLPHSANTTAHDDAAWRPWFIAISIIASLAISAGLTYFVERPLLGSVRRQSFAFDWAAVWRRVLSRRTTRPEAAGSSLAAPETRT